MSMLDLPVELLCSILSHLDRRSLTALCITTKQYMSLLQESYAELWHSMANALLIKPLRYTYTSVEQFNEINNTEHNTWVDVYFYLKNYANCSVLHEDNLSYLIKKGSLEAVRLVLINSNLNIWESISCENDGPMSEDDFYSIYFPNDRLSHIHYIYYIYTACIYNYQDIVSEMLSHPKFTDHGDLNLLFLILCKEGRNNCVKLLLKDLRVNLTYKHNEGIMISVMEKNMSVLRTLLEDPRTDPTDQNYEAFKLMITINSLGHRSLIHLLLDDYRVINSLGVGMDKNKMLELIHQKITT